MEINFTLLLFGVEMHQICGFLSIHIDNLDCTYVVRAKMKKGFSLSEVWCFDSKVAEIY
jgi:hypothetical protein